MASVDNISIGPGFVRFRGVDLGYTKGGIEVDINTSTESSMNRQNGETPEKIFIVGRTASITVPLAESHAQQLDRILENVTFLDSGGVQTSTVSGATGLDIMALAGELVVGHLESDGSFSGATIFPKALVMGPLKYSYRHDQERVLMATFTAYPDSSQSDQLMQFKSVFTL